MTSLRLTKQDTPIIAVSTVASVSLAAIFWVVAHHGAAGLPPETLLPPPPGHSHPAQTLPAVHHSQTTPNPNPGIVVLADRQPNGGRASSNPPVVPPPSTSSPPPTPSPSPERSPAPIVAVSPACLQVLVLNVCTTKIGVTP